MENDDLELLKQTAKQIAKLQQKITSLENKIYEPIAVIGMSCRFPGGANNPNLFWQLLEKDLDGSIDVPDTRWNVDDFYDPHPGTKGKIISRKSCFLTGAIDEFDAQFFRISTLEAEYLDPQQRLLLEVAWEALENAKLSLTSLKKILTGVFVGISTTDYRDLLIKNLEDQEVNAYTGTGNAASTAVGRISFALDLKGPCFSVDTACSSSLVALHEACLSLRNGDCDLALTGGVNLLLSPYVTLFFSQANMLAADGHCKTFDSAADGYVRGEGCGIIVIKRLSDAQRDNDKILALIKGSAINQDGTSGGLTVPNGPSQEAVIKRALEQAHLIPDEIDYIEAHGTGTSLGDPIEINALTKVFKGRKDPLTVGTVKTNIGHLEAAAGIAAIIKTILALQHEKIPRHMHFNKINPAIHLEDIPAQLPLQPLEWKKQDGKVRRAGVSAFAFSGTNTHVILEEAPEQKIIAIPDDIQKLFLQQEHLLIVSAKTNEALEARIQQYKNYLAETTHLIQDICYTSQVGCTIFEKKIAIAGKDLEELILNLENQHYVEDAQIDKTNYHYSAAVQPYLRLVRLPVYPFQRKHYWIEALSQKERKRNTATQDSAQEKNKLDLLTVLDWEKYDISLAPQDLKGNWLVLGGDEKTRNDLSDKLRKEQIGTIFCEENLDITQLPQVNAIICLEAIMTPESENIAFINKTFTILKNIIAQRTITRVIFLTSGVFSLENSHMSNASGLLGLFKTLAIEQPFIKWQLIEVNTSFIPRIIYYLKYTTEPQTIWEGVQPFRQRIKKVNANMDIFNDPTLDLTGIYIITGGAGILGKQVVAWLIERGIKKIQIWGRKATSSENIHWAETLMANSQVQILLCSVDVADFAQVNSALMTAKEMGKISGIFHLAGIINDGLIPNLTPEQIQTVIAPKMLGAWNLHQATKNMDLNLFMAFSSIASSLGSPGQANYAFANSFVDELMRFRRGQGLSGVSINWGPVAGTQMAASINNYIKQSNNLLDEENIKSALNAAINLNFSQLEVFNGDWEAVRDNSFSGQVLFENIVENQFVEGYIIEELLKLKEEQRFSMLSNLVGEMIMQVLKIKEIDEQVLFFDLGMDSLMALQITNRLTYGIGKKYMISNTIFFEQRNLHDLCEHLKNNVLVDLFTVDYANFSNKELMNLAANLMDENKNDKQ